jgi:hypothetical protein
MRQHIAVFALAAAGFGCGQVSRDQPDAHVAPPDAADAIDAAPSPDAPAAPDAMPCATGSQTFTFTNAEQTFVVPACVTSIHIIAYGAQGGNGSAAGGLGGEAEGSYTVSPGETLLVYVGGAGTTTSTGGAGGGFNGGANPMMCCGTAPSGGGGGASDVRRTSDLSTRMIVGGGGGGGGWQTFTGGGGGGLAGIDGTDEDATYQGGFGGTQIAGGAYGWYQANYPNEAGGFGFGGRCWFDGAGCGGGGGGWYGGGGGGFSGGGGGSSYVGAGAGGSTAAAVQFGNGQITISW